MKIAIAGCGYVGLSIGTLLCARHDISFVDISQSRIDQLKSFVSPIRDPEIERVFADRPRFLATTDPSIGYSAAQLIFICVPTDYSEEAGKFDTSKIESALEAIDRVNQDAVICIKSTVPIGYTRTLAAKYPGHAVLFSPEFLREGRALEDNRNPSRIVVGHGEAEESAKKVADLLKENACTSPAVLICDYEEAESIKLFSNTYLAMRIAFFNELDTYAKTKGFDANTIIKGVSLDPRIGDFYNHPSFGYGGYCLPKDTKQLLSSYGDIPADLISATIESNKDRKRFILRKAKELAKSKKVAIDRLISKPGSDNYRQSPAVEILEALVEQGYDVYLYEPLVNEPSFHGAKVIKDYEEFKELDALKLRPLLNEIGW